MADNFFGITDIGRVRTNNEDAFIAQKTAGGHYILACVIDGVGGYEGGEVAAAMARQTIIDAITAAPGDAVAAMQDAFITANRKIAAEKKGNPDFENMACVATLALIDIKAKTFHYAHIGDTRLYLLRDRSLVKISKDQSFVGYLEDSGRLSEEEAMQHPKRNEINKAIGFDVSLQASDIETGTSPFLPGDMLLLCSDGLSDLLKSSEMAAVLLSDGTLPSKGAELIRLANARGGKDNITVVLVRHPAKPKVQKATRPAATFSKPHVAENVGAEQPDRRTEVPAAAQPERSRPNSVNRLLIGVCIVLAAAVAALLLQRNKAGTLASVAAKDSSETAMQARLDTMASNLFLLTDSLTTLHDTIWLRRDSVHIKGSGMGVLKSSSFSGPAFAMAQTCNYVLLENLTLQNFDVGVLVRNNALRLKNVRFVGCRVPVLSQMNVPGHTAVWGGPDSFFTFDSLPN